MQIADLIIDPLCRGVYAGDAKEITVKALMKTLFEAEQQHGSVLKGIIFKNRGIYHSIISMCNVYTAYFYIIKPMN